MRLQTVANTFAAAIVLAGLLASACDDDGSGEPDISANPTYELSAEEQAEFDSNMEFAQCLRDQGIEGYPDPQISEDGYILVGVPLDPADLDEWTDAQRACAPSDGDDEQQREGTVPEGWEQIVPGGDCQCSDGSEFSFWVRKANPEKVVLFLQGGGGCWSAETCDPEVDDPLYRTTTREGTPPTGGVFDFADERNPFADYSFVYVPYCTGDVHIGNATTEYGPDLTVQHKGYVNDTAALDHMVATFPDATDVVVIGESAGSVAAPLYAGLITDRLPDSRVNVFADGSGSYPDDPDLNARLAAAWSTADTIPPWPENEGVTAEQWTNVPALFIQSGRHDPDIVFARHDYAYDENQTSWYQYFGIPVGDLLSRIDANETQIEAAGVNLLSYIAPSDQHTVFSDGPFYAEDVNGEKLVDWVARIIEGEPVGDVHCTECTGE